MINQNTQANNSISGSIETYQQSNNCFDITFRSFDDLDSTTCEPYINNCDLDYNSISITNFSKNQNQNFFEYNISYCCNSLGVQAGFCSLFWYANCDALSSVEGPSTTCVGSSSDFFNESTYVPFFNSWFYNSYSSRLEYHTNQGLCSEGCLDAYAYTPSASPQLNRPDTFSCPNPPYTPTSTTTETPATNSYYVDNEILIHDNIRFAGDEPLPNECCMTAVSEVTSKPNSSDKSFRVFYKTTSENLLYDQVGSLYSPYNSGSLIEDYSDNFYIKPGAKPSSQYYENKSSVINVQLMASTPTETSILNLEGNFVSIVSSSGSAVLTPTESSSLKIQDIGLVEKTFTFNDLSSIESSRANLAQFNSSYWLRTLPQVIYNSSDLSSVDSNFLPKIVIHNSLGSTQSCTFNFSGNGLIESESSKTSFKYDYSSSNSDVFINLNSMPFNFLTSDNFFAISDLDPVNNIYSFTASVFLSIDIEYIFEIESSIYDSEKNDRLSFCPSNIINRREKIKVYLNPSNGVINDHNEYVYPNSYGVDSTIPLYHTFSLNKGFVHRLS
jgi:hypothetical protein